MDNQELRNLLEQLHNEIEQTGSVDEKGQELLRDLGTDINKLLERSESDRTKPQPQTSTINRLEDGIDYFEVTHPALTVTLTKLLAILSNAGI